MVFKGLFGGNSGSFNNVADFYGYYNDTVYGVYEADVYTYSISTYRGKDLIDLRDLNVNSASNIYAGAGNDTVYGSAGTNFFLEQSGDDIAFLGAGVDYYFLGKGDDKVDGGSGADSINLAFNYNDFGTFSDNYIAVTLDLQKTTAQNFGVLGLDTLKNFENVYGGFGNDKIYGTSAINVLNGFIGDDYIDGRAGNDTITGNGGRDTLIGGTGGDQFYLFDSGTARDHIRFLKTNESSATSSAQGSADWIDSFDKGITAGVDPTQDRIDFSRIDARASTTTVNDAFFFRGVGGAFSSVGGEIRIVESGGNSYVYVDTDSDAGVEMRIVVSGVIGLTAADFIL